MTAPNEINIKLPLYKFQTLMQCYVRDSLHDHGAKVQRCIYDVKAYWHYLGSDARDDISHNVKFFITEYHPLRNDSFFQEDLAAWGELIDWMDENRNMEQTFTRTRPIVPMIPVVNPKQREK